MEANRGRDPFPGFLASQAGQAIETSLTSSNTSPSSRRARVRPNHARGHAWGLVFLSAAASIAAVAFLISMCSRTQMRNHAFHARSRQLSSSRNPKGGFQGMCGEDGDEEAWIISDDSDSDTEQPLQKRPRLVEEAGEGSRLTERFEGSRAAGGGVGVTPGHRAQGTSQGYSAHLRPSRESFSAAAMQWNKDELEAAAALLQLQLGQLDTVTVDQLSGLEGQTIYRQQSEPHSETQIQRGKKTPAGKILRLPRFLHVAGTAGGSAQASDGSAARIVPSAGGQAYDALPGASVVESPRGIGHHFVRLPTVEPTRGGVRFRPEVALSGALFPNSPVRLLCSAHDLLRKQHLSLEELRTLAMIAEELVAHAIYYQTCKLPVARPTRAAGMLGIRFLIFDTVLSTLHLLGQRPEPYWWERFANTVPHIFENQFAQVGFGTDKVLFNRRLINDLTSAMHILKTGQRAPVEDTIRIKERLFTSIHSPPPFRSKRFDSWRRDLFPS